MRGTVFSSHTFALRQELGTVTSSGFHEQVPRYTFQTVIDRNLFGPNVLHGMNTLTRWLTNSGCVAQAFSSPTHSSTVRQTIMSAMSQQLQSDLCVAAAKDQPQHRPLLPKLDILAVDLDEELQEEWEAEDDVNGGPLDPHEAKKCP